MNALQGVAVAAAGVFAGGINTVVGSGTLLTFPVLLAVGYPPVTANISNTLGLVPGSVAGVIGYREELRGQIGRLLRLGTAALLGGVLGAVLLFVLPSSAFDAIVPALIGIALVLVVAQPWLTRRLAARREIRPPREHGGAVLVLGVFGTGIYGGYFGAAQGVLLMALLLISLHDDPQRLNATKNVLALLVNSVAAVLFIAVGHVAWAAAGLIAGGSVVGGWLGARVGRGLSPRALRGVIVVVGVAAMVKLLAS